MDEAATDAREDYLGTTVKIVVAYVCNNSVPANRLCDLIVGVHGAISGLAAGGSALPKGSDVGKPTPAQIKKSIGHDGLVSFEDGKRYKTLRRHLATRGLTPEAYRTRHGLPEDYPMTCPGYSAQRAELARAMGLRSLRKVEGGVEASRPVRAVPPAVDG